MSTTIHPFPTFQEKAVVAELMKQVMRVHDLNQSGLAQVLEVSLSRVKAMTSGRVKNLKRHEQEALISKLGVRAEWLVTGEGSMTEMHPEQIKAQLRMKGITPTALADELGVGHSSVSLVISGKSVSRRIRASIADILGVPVDALWPPAKAQPVLRRTRAQVAAMRARVAA